MRRPDRGGPQSWRGGFSALLRSRNDMKADIALRPAKYAACRAAKAAKPSQTLDPPDTTAIVTVAPRMIDAASNAPARYRIPSNRPSNAAARMVHQFTDRSLCLDSHSDNGRTYGGAQSSAGARCGELSRGNSRKPLFVRRNPGSRSRSRWEKRDLFQIYSGF